MIDKIACVKRTAIWQWRSK